MVPPNLSTDAKNFDAAFWKRVNSNLDQALELSGVALDALLSALQLDEPRVAAEVRKMLARASQQSASSTSSAGALGAGPLTAVASPGPSVAPLATAWVRSEGVRPGLTTQLAPVLGAGGERGFDDLLQRALKAGRHRQKMTRNPGERCGAWRIESLLGSGGMGDVWLATRADGLFEAKAAIKFLRAESSSEGFEARFAQERALLARLNHPRIARLLDAGHQNGSPFLVIEYVEGTPLLDYVERFAPTTDARLALIRQIGEAISYAHSQLVVHRDLKPSNVLISNEGFVKLLDFGVAGLITDREHFATTESPATRLTGRGITLEYAAPEQITGESSGVASDVYSLGALTYHLLTGQRAYLPEVPGRAALEHAILHTDAPRVSDGLRTRETNPAKDTITPVADDARVNADIDAIVAKAMRRNAADRYATAGELVADLRRFAERRPISTRREDRAYRSRLWLRRNWLPVGLGGTLMMSLCVGLAASMWQYHRSRAEADRANRTVDFMIELLGRADPDLHGGKIPNALDLLDAAAKESHNRFRDEPATEERLSRLFARVYRSLSQDTVALPLARRSVELASNLYGTDALETLRARSELALILYWSDDNEQALKEMQPVFDRLPKHIAYNAPEMLETRQRYANILAGDGRTTESEKVLRELIEAYEAQPKDVPTRAWKIADVEGDLAANYTRASRWQEALNLMRKNAAIYELRPAMDLKTALTHQGNLITVQNILGDPRGVESKIRALIEQWRSLAGEKTERIDELLNDLGVYYVVAGDAANSEKTYSELRDRVRARSPNNDGELLRTELDLIEIRARFHLASDAQVLSGLQSMVDRVLEKIPPTSHRFRHYLARGTVVAAGYGRSDLAQTWLDTAAARGKDSNRGNDLRMIDARNQWARSRGDHDTTLEGLKKRLAVMETNGEKTSLRRAFRELDAAYTLTLLGTHDATTINAAFARTRAAVPEGVPSDHRIYRQIAFVTALAQHGKSSAEFIKARDALAADFKRTGSEMPSVLGGFYVMPF